MPPVELQALQLAPRAAARDERWRRAARRARLLSWLSLCWMAVEGALGANAVVGAWWLDAVIALGLAAFAVNEGREAWRSEGCCVGGPLDGGCQADCRKRR